MLNSNYVITVLTVFYSCFCLYRENKELFIYEENIPAGDRKQSAVCCWLWDGESYESVLPFAFISVIHALYLWTLPHFSLKTVLFSVWKLLLMTTPLA